MYIDRCLKFCIPLPAASAPWRTLCSTPGLEQNGRESARRQFMGVWSMACHDMWKKKTCTMRNPEVMLHKNAEMD